MPSDPRMPSAPPSGSVMMGSFLPLSAMSPITSESTRIVETTFVPVTPRTRTCSALLGLILRASATLARMPVWLAPVSSTRRKGPCSLMYTGAQIRPILSRFVGAT